MPHKKEAIESVALEEGKEVKIGTHIAEDTRQGLIELLCEFKDIFTWSCQDMPRLNTDIVVHRLPIRQDCKPVQQKLRRMRPDIVLKIKDEVKKQFDAGFLQEVKYSEWVANIVPVPKKDGKIKMHLEDMDKTTFITLWGTFCYKVMPFGLKNARATYQRAMVTLFHDIMYKEIEVYVDDMIAKSRTEEEHIEVLRKRFLRLRKFQLKLNPVKCTFGARSGKLLGFVVSEKEIEVDSDKVRAYETCLHHVLRRKFRNAFDKVKQYLLNAPVLSPPSPDKPLIPYLSVFSNSIGCVLGQHDESGRKEKAELMCVATVEDCSWKLSFDGASNAVGNGIGAVLVSPNADYYPFTCKLDFDCTNNMAEYEACIMGLRAAIEQGIRTLEVYGDSALVIYQLRGEWEIRDLKLINYRKIILGLLEEFDDITFNYIPRYENQITDALATLASLIRVNKEEEMRPIQMSIFEAPASCCNIEEEEKDDNPWYQDILRYVRDRKYPEQATENDKRTLRRLACDYVLDGDILYKRRKDQVLLRCVDAVEAKLILEEVHEGVCGTHANGFTMARQIMRFGYYWSTMEGDCINYAKKCHKCQIYRDKIHRPHSPLHVMTSPWPFSMWGMDVIGPISPKASNGHHFIFVVIDYFTKWVEVASYANVTKSTVS
ncbi:hypothetical protein CXB51_028151 [Gossypium anomalum]|uniref:Uncharacterized protein n=1 Tax=Gossypium anomalum TaxID=47600 RepID=A0A8J6CKD3_9ROSI|nr:hypothetical protein CXB51_028151 [Gossypium anomalum]